MGGSAPAVIILRACESIDFCVFQHESNQGLKTRKNVEIRIDSQTLRSALRASRRMAACAASITLRGSPKRLAPPAITAKPRYAGMTAARAARLAGPGHALRRASCLAATSFLAPAIASQPVPKAKDINSLLSELHGTAENTGISRMPFTSLVL